MKKHIFSLIVLILLSSCAKHMNINSRDVLHIQYMKYASLLNNHDYLPAIDMLSKRNLDDLISHSNKQFFVKHFPVISTINQVLAVEQGYFEKLNINKGCLTIFGVDSSNEPTSMNIEYVNEADNWKLDYIQVMYHGSKTELPHEAKCPIRI